MIYVHLSLLGVKAHERRARYANLIRTIFSPKTIPAMDVDHDILGRITAVMLLGKPLIA